MQSVLQMSRMSYYADFLFYPLAVVALTSSGLWYTPLASWPAWLLSALIGLGIWTLAEYLLHRFVLHHVPYVQGMHDAHHADQKALIGTPTWLSMAIMLGVLLPIWYVTGYSIASALMVGLILGYLWYISVHHIVHHWEPRLGSYGYALRRRHALHHHFDDMGNFGVSSGFWDKIFGTDIKGGRKIRDKRARG
jgi:sterol desaturase/sphingolipid hydroxylase (fatty acid hydroxylase superfamily)